MRDSREPDVKERLTPRERVLFTLRRLPVDRTPGDIWCTPEVMASLLHHFGTNDAFAVYDALGVDKLLWVEAPWKKQPRVEGGVTFTPWGNGFRPVGNRAGSYEETVFYPLQGVEDPKRAAEHEWPSPDDFDYEALQESCRRGARWVRMLSFISLFEIYCKLKPMNEALMDLLVNPDLAHVIFDRVFRFMKAYIERSAKACGDLLDIVGLSDDMGMQDRPLVSMEVWAEYFRDPYRELFDLTHSLGLHAFYHSDGAAYEALEAVTRLGADIINPIQYTCPGMQRERLKRTLGHRVVFHGAVENQRVIPFGTPGDVAREVREDIRILGAGGGYICAPCHNIQAGTPLENILALYRTVREG